MNAYRTEARLRIEKLGGILSENPELQPLYQRAKKVVRVFRRPAFYEISQRCNLWCEGCYYFDEGRVHTHEMEELNEWKDFFSAEKARGVSMAYFVGAEPALEQERLLQSVTCFPHGNIGTNGTVALHRDIPFRIGVSVWAGDDETDKALRGGSVFRKALKNYQGDRRAIMLYTVTRQNIDETRLVAEMCRDHDVELTFNMYSPTHSFEKKLMNFIENDKEFFRISSPGNTPCLDEDHLLKVRETLGGLIDDYPGTVLYSHAYNRWATTPGPLYDIDPETGVARNCGSRIIEPMRYYDTALKQSDVKCCTPSVDCEQCRMYSGGWSSHFDPSESYLKDAASLREWLETIDVLGRIFVRENPHFERAA